jgi:hypothetical protein
MIPEAITLVDACPVSDPLSENPDVIVVVLCAVDINSLIEPLGHVVRLEDVGEGDEEAHEAVEDYLSILIRLHIVMLPQVVPDALEDPRVDEEFQNCFLPLG